MLRMHSRTLALLCGLAAALPGGGATADMYRWVDAKGVVNYSNRPPPANVSVQRIAETEPAVSIIPPPERVPIVQRKADEVALVRRIEQLEDELAQLRRVAARPPARFPYAGPLLVGYMDYSVPIAYPAAEHPRATLSRKPRQFVLHSGRFNRPRAVAYGARRWPRVWVGR